MNSIDHSHRHTRFPIELTELIHRQEIPLYELERQASSALQAKHDFDHSRWPSSIPHGVGRVISTALMGGAITGGVVLTCSSIVMTVNMASFLTSEEPASPYMQTLKEDGEIAGVIAAGSLAVTAGCYQGARRIDRWIDTENEQTSKDLQSRVDSTQEALARSALRLTEHELLEVLDRNVLQAEYLVKAMKDDNPKTVPVLLRILDQGRLTQPAIWASEKVQDALPDLGGRLANQLMAKTGSFIDRLDGVNFPEAYLAILALAPTAMITDTPAEFGAYLTRNPEVVKKAVRLMKSVRGSQAARLVAQHEEGRMAGLTRDILNAARATN